MSKKTLLNEATVRKFMKFANIEGLAKGFVNEMYAKEEELEEAMHDEGREDKVEEDLDEGRHDEGREDKVEEAAHDEGRHDEGRGVPPMEEAAHEMEEAAHEMEEAAHEDDEMKMDDEAEVEDTSEASVEALVDALADTISRVTGVEVTAADDAPPMDDAPDLDAPADDLDLDAAPEADEEPADDLLDEEEMIEETVRRVTSRIAAAKKRDQLAETITSRIMERLASKK